MKPTLQNLVRTPAFFALWAGVAFAVGGPPFPAALIPVAYLGLATFAWLLQGLPPWRALGRGFAFGLGMNLVVLVFVPATIVRFTEIPWSIAIALGVLLAAAQGSIFAVAGVVTSFAERLGAPLAVAFPAGVAASMFTPQLFAWTVATPLARAPIALQPAELIGERGLAIVVAAACALLAGTLRGPRIVRRARGAGALAIVAALVLYGGVRRVELEPRLARARHATIALVQQAIPPTDRWDPALRPYILQTLWSLTRAAQDQGADLAVWPEAAYPYELRSEGGVDAGLERIRGPNLRLEILTGALTRVPTDRSASGRAAVVDHYNAAVIVTRDAAYSPAAAKLELLPFGEAVPFGEELPFLRRAFARGGGLRPGREVVLLESTLPPRVRAGILNCYEDTLPSIARRIARARPNLLVNVTNDAWFGDTAEPELHLLAATARAIEARRDMVRAVNTGVTAHLDALGRIVARAPREARTVLLVHPALLDDEPTPYVRFGDATWVAPLAIGLLAAFVRRRREA